jgi:hypothetical protein
MLYDPPIMSWVIEPITANSNVGKTCSHSSCALAIWCLT